MAKGEFLVKYQDLSTEDRRTFDRWLKANAVIASIFAMALVAIAINSSGPPWPATATAKSAETGDIIASVKRPNLDDGLSAYELMIRVANELPVQEITDPF